MTFSSVLFRAETLSQAGAHLEAHSDFAFVDLRATQIRGKKRGQTRERTGTHWTPIGILLCHEVIIEHPKDMRELNNFHRRGGE